MSAQVQCLLVDAATGEIVQVMAMPPDVAAAQAEPGQIVKQWPHGDAHDVERDYRVDVDAPGMPVVLRDQAERDAWRLHDAKRDAQKRASIAFRRFQKALISGVPEGERLSWARKEEAAERYLAGSATARDLAMLGAEAAVLGATEAEVAASIIAKADAYAVASGHLSGVRQAVLDAIDAATTVAEVDAALAGLAALEGE